MSGRETNRQLGTAIILLITLEKKPDGLTILNFRLKNRSKPKRWRPLQERPNHRRKPRRNRPITLGRRFRWPRNPNQSPGGTKRPRQFQPQPLLSVRSLPWLRYWSRNDER